MFKPDKHTLYKLGNSESTGVIGRYRFPRSIHKDLGQENVNVGGKRRERSRLLGHINWKDN